MHRTILLTGIFALLANGATGVRILLGTGDQTRRFDIQTDPMVEKAVESLPKAQALLDNVRRVMAQRMSH